MKKCYMNIDINSQTCSNMYCLTADCLTVVQSRRSWISHTDAAVQLSLNVPISKSLSNWDPGNKAHKVGPFLPITISLISKLTSNMTEMRGSSIIKSDCCLRMRHSSPEIGTMHQCLYLRMVNIFNICCNRQGHIKNKIKQN